LEAEIAEAREGVDARGSSPWAEGPRAEPGHGDLWLCRDGYKQPISVNRTAAGWLAESAADGCRDSTAARVHRAVDLELTVGLSGALFQALDAAELDLVLAKRRPGEDRGRLVRRERLVWVAGDPALADPERPLPLILYPPPSISRAMALEALENAGRSWRIVCTSSSLSGLNAAALAGLGICAQADGFVPNGLAALPRSAELPELGHIEFVAAGSGRTLRGPANALATAILDSADRL
jgi:DNA-binding transcriptional LysR family regulator